MVTPLLHLQTASQLARIIAAKPHAVLITALDGMGKGMVAGYIGEQILGTAVAVHPYVCHIVPDEKMAISVETMRQLQGFMRLKTTGTNTVRRLVIVEHADCMTTEAQNAFLKLLEEPPADTVIILTAQVRQKLLPTIVSRVQEIALLTPEADEVKAFFSKQYATGKVTQAYFLSGGAPGLMAALLADDQEHPLVKAVAQAKQFLQQDTFERLATIDQFKQKGDAVRLCMALERIAQTGVTQASSQTDSQKITRWHRILRAAVTTHDMLDKNVQTKLALTHLMLQFS